MLGLLFKTCLVLSVASAAWGDPSIVKLDSGTVQGIVWSTFRAFLGIPFAAPPVDELRWQPPQPVKSWEGTRFAFEYGNSCYQTPTGITSGTQVSEDCLYINVYTPYPIPEKPVPIMIFIYGGAYVAGSSSYSVYNPENDITMVEDVIMVNFNYRLGAFGFLAAQSLRNQDPDGSTGNYGLQDQRFAMQWVQRNGAAFGGDINRVTIFGESAGAGSVSNHLLQPKAWPYFHRAISESGPIADWTAQPLDFAIEKYKQFAVNGGCCQSIATCKDADANVLLCLRRLNSSAVLNASIPVPGGLLQWSPVIDGVEVVGDPMTLLVDGKVANVPVIFGTNKDEGSTFTTCPTDEPTDKYTAYMTGYYGQALGTKVVAEYPVNEYPSAFWASSRALGDVFMSCHALSAAHAIAQSRERLHNSTPVYVYLFNHTLQYIQQHFPYYGCCHTSELYLVFDYPSYIETPAEQQLANAFVKYWTSFAASGVPGDGTGLPTWPAFTSNNQVTGVLDVNTLLTPVSGVKADVCTFWANNPLPPSVLWGIGSA